jgi:PAS domain S-box-containing protein
MAVQSSASRATARHRMTKRRRAAATPMLDPEAWSASTLEYADEAVICTSLEGTVTVFNAAAERLYGFRRDEIIGQHCQSMTPPELSDELVRAWRAMRAHIAIQAFDTVRLTRSGARIAVRLAMAPIDDGTGRVVGFMSLARPAQGSTDTDPSSHAAQLDARILAAAAALQNQIRERERLAGRLLQLQDEERRRIGRELHDGTGQQLVALTMTLARLSGLCAGQPAAITDAVAESRALLDHCLREVRTLSYLLHPPLLDESGLVSATQWLADGFAKRSGIAVSVRMAPDFGRLPRAIELALFRIVQETLTNVHRHADSPSVRIVLRRGRSSVLLAVSDAGRGLSSAEASSEGVGIPGMRERLRRLGGYLLISSDAHGTTVRALVPLTTRARTGRGPTSLAAAATAARLAL